MQLKNIPHRALILLARPFLVLKNFVLVDMRMVMKNFARHDGELSTCALAFFLLISFIPVSLVIISVLSFFYKSDTMAAFYLSQVKHQLPAININELISIIDRIVYKKRYHAFIWIPFLFWWGSFVFDIIERGLEKAFHIESSRKYWKAKIRHFIIIVGIAFTILTLTFVSNFLAIINNNEIMQIIREHLASIGIMNLLPLQGSWFPLFVTSLTTLFINTTFIFIIYRFVPPKKMNNRSILKGALFASFSYEVVKMIFSYYIKDINDYSSIFGSLNTIVILMIWIWYTCFLFIIGAEMAWVFYEKNVRAEKLNFSE